MTPHNPATKSSSASVFLIQTVSVYLALIFCQLGLIHYVDRVSGFSRLGDRHDYLLPGEGPLLLSVYGLCAASATYLALRFCQRLSVGAVSRKAALWTATPAAILGLTAFQFSSARLLDPIVSPSLDSVSLFVIMGTILGSSIPLRRPTRFQS